jgi:hypothetical protein
MKGRKNDVQVPFRVRTHTSAKNVHLIRTAQASVVRIKRKVTYPQHGTMPSKMVQRLVFGPLRWPQAPHASALDHYKNIFIALNCPLKSHKNWH